MEISDLFSHLRGASDDRAGAAGSIPTDASEAEHHYRLAMRAARRIGRARSRGSKTRNGSLVCRHLQAMLAAEDGTVVQQRRQRPASRAA